jgi:hypothetical protein
MACGALSAARGEHLWLAEQLEAIAPRTSQHSASSARGYCALNPRGILTIERDTCCMPDAIKLVRKATAKDSAGDTRRAREFGLALAAPPDRSLNLAGLHLAPVETDRHRSRSAIRSRLDVTFSRPMAIISPSRGVRLL